MEITFKSAEKMGQRAAPKFGTLFEKKVDLRDQFFEHLDSIARAPWPTPLQATLAPPIITCAHLAQAFGLLPQDQASGRFASPQCFPRLLHLALAYTWQA